MTLFLIMLQSHGFLFTADLTVIKHFNEHKHTLDKADIRNKYIKLFLNGHSDSSL